MAAAPPASARYALPVPRPLRLTSAVLGPAALVYGKASLTGGWLGTPPWWERATPPEPYEWPTRYRADQVRLHLSLPPPGDADGWNRSESATAGRECPRHVEAASSRERFSGYVIAAGLALAAFGEWPRRRRTEAGTRACARC